MALPLRKTNVDLPEDPGPKIVPMPVYGFDAADLQDSAAKEVEFVLRKAAASSADSSATHRDFGKQVAAIFDRTMQNAVASSYRGIGGLRDLAEKEPLRFIAIVAASAFVVGFGARIWRSSRG